MKSLSCLCDEIEARLLLNTLKALFMCTSHSTQNTGLLLHIYFLLAVICITRVFLLCHIALYILRASVIPHFLSSTKGNNVKTK